MLGSRLDTWETVVGTATLGGPSGFKLKHEDETEPAHKTQAEQ